MADYTFYHASGSVRGSCGHMHRTIVAAYRCAQRDVRDCHALGGGAYSDRVVARTDGEALTDDEQAELDALEVERG